MPLNPDIAFLLLIMVKEFVPCAFSMPSYFSQMKGPANSKYIDLIFILLVDLTSSTDLHLPF